MLNFCTLFNSSYLVYGLSLYESLKQQCESFHLYIYAFDQEIYEYFKSKSLNNITVLKLDDFEDERLLEIKPGRTFGEYCWTCTPSIILHAINTFHLDACVYVDSDLYFFSSPQPLIDEMDDNSVLITEHRYTSEYDQSAASGIYCVQFMYFKNDERGMKVLNWWRNACLDWCFNRFEDGKFGDQKYLDDWLTKFEGVHSLQHLGGGVAPWNVQQYQFFKENGKLNGKEKQTETLFPLIFYHFHGMKFFEDNVVKLTSEIYDISSNVVAYIYKPYLHKAIETIAAESNFSFMSPRPESHLHKINLLPLYNRLKIQCLIDNVKQKKYKQLFYGGNYYRQSAFKN